MNKLPVARSKNIVVQSLQNEVLIYDLSSNRALCLNPTSANVFNACNGFKTFEDLKKEYGYTEDLIHLTLDALAKENLLAGEYESKLAGLSRREAIRKVGLATMIALPLITPLIAPKAADAASAVVNRCRTLNCVDGNQDCNNGSPCSALGGGNVCCAGTGSCTCVPANVCLGFGGQICP